MNLHWNYCWMILQTYLFSTHFQFVCMELENVMAQVWHFDDCRNNRLVLVMNGTHPWHLRTFYALHLSTVLTIIRLSTDVLICRSFTDEKKWKKIRTYSIGCNEANNHSYVSCNWIRWIFLYWTSMEYCHSITSSSIIITIDMTSAITNFTLNANDSNQKSLPFNGIEK